MASNALNVTPQFYCNDRSGHFYIKLMTGSYICEKEELIDDALLKIRQELAVKVTPPTQFVEIQISLDPENGTQ